MLTDHYARANKHLRITTFAAFVTLRTFPVPSHLESHFAAVLDPRDTTDSPAGGGIPGYSWLGTGPRAASSGDSCQKVIKHEKVRKSA